MTPRTIPRPRRDLPVRLAAVTLLVLGGCGDDGPDAYGNFEAEEVAVSAELSGPLLFFGVREGQRLAAGERVGLLDTVPVALQRDELVARREVASLRAEEAAAQVSVVEAQLATAREDRARVERLWEAEAATDQQRVQARGAVRVLEEQLGAARARVRSARQEVEALGVQLAQVQDRWERSRVLNPRAGTVLATYVEAGEFVQAGRPLYTVADLDTLTLRAWVSGAQLADIRLGQEVAVRVDAGADRLRTLPGRVSWIASEAEFTPTPIQTREERISQVYGVKVRVPNPDGVLKVGMPGELVLPRGGAEQPSATPPGHDGRPAGDGPASSAPEGRP
jgi:HlyD family secretion protein